MTKLNRLAKENSPYLLQHAQNPVDWYPWGEEAFMKAEKENKPVFISIGYSTCHWCHVMKRESFEDEEVAEVIVTATVGGTTSPVPGTYTYDRNDIIKIEAIPTSGYAFLHWVITGGYTPGHNEPPLIIPDPDVPQPPPRPPVPGDYDSLVVQQNPLYVECGFGYTYEYQAVFVSETPETNLATVVVKESVGGATDPVPGTYTFAEGSSVILTATPITGYQFMAWLATGGPITGHEEILIMDNPLDVMCGVGYTYEYLPIFTLEDSDVDSGGIPEMYYIAGIIILAIVAIIAIAAALMYRGRAK